MPKKFVKFDYQIPSIVPTFLKGEDAWRLYKAIKKDEKVNIYLGDLEFSSAFQEIKGSSSLRNGQINRIVADSGLRTVVPTDDIYGVIFPLIIGTALNTDFNSLDVRKEESGDNNLGLSKKLVKLAEEHQGRVKFPFRIQGFYTVFDKRGKDYEVKIIPANNFEIIHDKRLNIAPGTKFSGLDEKGMIIPDKKGKYTWCSTNERVTGVYLDGEGDLNCTNISSSNNSGKVILIQSEKNGSQRHLRSKLEELQKITDKEIKIIDDAHAQAIKTFFREIEGKK